LEAPRFVHPGDLKSIKMMFLNVFIFLALLTFIAFVIGEIGATGVTRKQSTRNQLPLQNMLLMNQNHKLIEERLPANP
jgi:hypothetical protein